MEQRVLLASDAVFQRRGREFQGRDFMVDDQKAKVAEFDAANVPHVRDSPAALRQMSLIRNAPSEKFIGPTWVHFDVRDKGWNAAIRSNTQLYELKPVTSNQ